MNYSTFLKGSLVKCYTYLVFFENKKLTVQEIEMKIDTQMYFGLFFRIRLSEVKIFVYFLPKSRKTLQKGPCSYHQWLSFELIPIGMHVKSIKAIKTLFFYFFQLKIGNSG